MGKGRYRKAVALVLAMSVGIVFSAGCYGKFQLTRSLYEVNRSVEDKYLRTVLTWVLIIPYGIAGLLDFAVFNLIEFWSGENPIVGAAQTRTFAAGDDKAVMTVSREEGATVATIEKYRGDRLVSALRIRDDGSGPVTSTVYENGNVSATMTATPLRDGSVSVETVSAAGTETVRFSPAAVETYRARVARISRDVQEARAAAGASPRSASARFPVPEG